VAGVGIFLLSTMNANTSFVLSAAYMLLLGIGIGLTMQVLVIATQNAVRLADLGVATSSVSFFRSVGGSIGVAVFGALFTHRLAADMPAELGRALPPASATPESIRHLPAAIHGPYVEVFANALTGVFVYAVPLLLVAFGLTWLLKEHPLRHSVHDMVHGEEGEEPQAVPELREPEEVVSAGPRRAETEGS